MLQYVWDHYLAETCVCLDKDKRQLMGVQDSDVKWSIHDNLENTDTGGSHC